MTQIDTIRHKYTQIDTYSHTIPHNMTHSWVGHKNHIYIYISIYIYTIFSFISIHSNIQRRTTTNTTTQQPQKKNSSIKKQNKTKKIHSIIHSKEKNHSIIQKNSQKPIEITIYRKFNEIHQIPGVPKNTIFTDFQAF